MAKSNDDWAQGFGLLIMRLVLGVLMVYYGGQNIFGWMGGTGFEASSQEFADQFQIMLYVGQIAMIGQMVAGAFLIFGFLTRFAALFVGVEMAIAAMIGVKTTETLVRTTSEDPLAAVGYPTALLVISFMLVLVGGGLASIDSAMFGKAKKAKKAKAAQPQEA